MPSFLDLARKINRKGDSFLAKNDVKNFHTVAAELLAQSQIEKAFDVEEIVSSVFTGKTPQHFKSLEFSDLPVTVAQGKNCFIDVYFWRRRPTVIHNHHFAGAFMCLLGNNVDLEFTFQKERTVGKYHQTGKLDLKQTRNIKPGDIAEIAYLDKFIHQNHHQADLTVNLCFRTPQRAGKSLANYLYTGLRYEKNVDLMGRVARLQKFIDLDVLDIKKASITNDDAIHFLIMTSGSERGNPKFIQLRKELNKRVKSECGLDIDKLIQGHDVMMEKIENDYE